MTKQATKTRTRILERLDELEDDHGWPGHGPWKWRDQFNVKVRGNTATVEWAELPDPAVIADALADLDDIEITIAHQWAWSDGMFWADSRDAYLSRHRDELEQVTYDGCGHCDGHIETTAEDAYDQLVAELGHAPDPGVVPGRFVRCPDGCVHGRRLIHGTRPKVEACTTCAPNTHLGVFDLDVADEAGRFTTAWDAARAEAWRLHDATRPATVPTIDEWLAANTTTSPKAAITKLLRRDQATLTRWLNDTSSR